MPNEQVLLAVIAGATILNGLFLVFITGYISFQLRNIWMVEMYMLDHICPTDDEDEVTEVSN